MTEEKVEEVKKESKFKPGCGLDIGTSHIVMSRQTKEGIFISKFHRNMLYRLEVSEDAVDLLERSDYLYVKINDAYYIVGEDALKLVNAIGKGTIIRTMANGLLNPSLNEASELLFLIIKAVVGEPIVKGEPLRFSIPANPVDIDADNRFHEMVLKSFFDRLKFNAKSVNEAICVGYDCNPKMKEGEVDIPLSGLCISAGAGMTNIALMYHGLELNSFSITQSGDNIDENVSRVTGVSKNKVIKIKEKQLDLDNIQMSDRVKSALGIYYSEMINRVIHIMAETFADQSSEMEGDIEIIVAGGTSMPPGFCNLFEKELKLSKMPFKIYQVRQAESPFCSVSQGACVRAQADYARIKEG